MTLPLTVAPGASAVIQLRFNPVAAGSRGGLLSIASNAAGSPHTVPLSGMAVAAPPEPSEVQWLKTIGNQIVLEQSETPFQLRSIHWYGFDIILMPLPCWDRAYRTVTYNGGVQLGLIDQVKQLGFNSIRLSVCEDLTWDTRPRILEGNGIHPANTDFFAEGADPNAYPQILKPSLEVLDLVIAYASSLGLRIILDMHCLAPNSSNAQGTMGKWYTTATPSAPGGNQTVVGNPRNEEQWIQAWEFYANRYKGNPYVCGFDLVNEPYACTWDDDPLTGWPAAAERCATRIAAINPKALIIVEGVAGNLVFQPGDLIRGTVWSGNLHGVHARPVRIPQQDRLVYSPHDYGTEGAAGVENSGPAWLFDSSFPGNMPGVWDTCFGFIARDEIAPLWEGEFGGPFGAGFAVNNQWVAVKRDYFAARHMSFSYFSLNESGGGVLAADRISVVQPIMDALQPLLTKPQEALQRPQAALRLRSQGGHLVDAAGSPYRFRAITWRGMDSGARFPFPPWQRAWRGEVDQIFSMGFDTIRLGIGTGTFGAGATLTTERVDSAVVNGLQNFDLLTGFDKPGILAIQALENILGYVNARKGRVILTVYDTGGTGNVGDETAWRAMCGALAARLKDHPAVLGMEIFSGPTESWGSWRPKAQATVNAIQAAAPGWMVWVPGVASGDGATYWPASNLAGVATNPVVAADPARLAYAVTEFGRSAGDQPWFGAGFPGNLAERWDGLWGDLVSDGVAAVSVMELGAQFGLANDTGASGQPYAAEDGQWMAALAPYLNARGMSWGYTSFGDAGTAGGILRADWITPQQGRLDALAPLLTA